MNERIRTLQKSIGDMHAEADGLLSKSAPSQAETDKALSLIGRIKSTRAEIETEFLAEKARRGLAALQSDADEPEPGSPLLSSTRQVTTLGMKTAGKTVIDSFGSVLEDVGAGAFGAKTFEHIQTPEYKSAFTRMLRRKGLDGLRGAEYKTIQEGLDDQGGAFVPADVLMRVIARKPTPTRVAGMCTTITTGRDRVSMPRQAYSADDTYSTAFRVSWTGVEIPPADPDVTDTGLTGSVEIPVFTAMLSASVTNDMVEDSGFPLMPWLESQIAISFDLLRDEMAISGTGNGQPRGMITNPGAPGQPAVIQTNTTAKVFGDDLFNACYAIPEQYEDGCSWVFNKTNTANGLRKLKDAQGRYLFGDGYQDSGLAVGRPRQLAGYPFVYSGFMGNLGSAANVAAANADGSVTGTTNNVFAIFGDLAGHYQVNRLGMTLQVLRETKAKRNQLELVARIRIGGKTVEPWRLRLLQVK